MNDDLVVLVTAGDAEEAVGIATKLVEEHLAACVNLVTGIRSIYRWEGRLVDDQETLLIVKTTAGAFTKLEQRVKVLHSYSTPEVIALRIERGSNEYLKWLRGEVEPPKDSEG